MEKRLIGIDLGGTTTKCAVVSVKGDIEAQWSMVTDVSDDGKNIIPNIIESIQRYLEEHHLSPQDIIGIGMGSPGNVNRDKGTVVGAYNLNWTTEQPIRELIEQATGISFYLDNDANVAALGEQWKGAGNNEPDVIFITLGTGVGGGIISDGKLVHGASDSAGEIGHLTVDPYSFQYQCTCGKVGCLETVASATGIVRVTKALLADSDQQSMLTDILEITGDIEAKDVFDCAKKGDTIALNIIDIITHYLAIAIGNLSCAVNPSTVVIGGGVSKAGSILLDAIERQLKPYLFPTIRETTHVRLAELENDAGVIGASVLVLKETGKDQKYA